ncbi:MAG: DUF1800 domain-containing protein [Terriglobales bacterium]
MAFLCGRRRLMAAALLLAGLVTTQFALGRKKGKSAALDEHKRAMQALNRLTFGPRPGDFERVAQMGVDKWIDLQLHPERIDDSVVDVRLAPFRTLRMNTLDIVENFPNNEMIRQVAEGKMPMPRDPTRRAVYEAQVQRYENKQDRKGDAAQSASANADASAAVAAGNAMLADANYQRRREENQAASIRLLELLDLPPDERFRAILKLSPEQQTVIARRAKGPKADALMQGMNGQEKETLGALNNPEQVVVDELTQAKLLRAISSERQLNEVMTDFWFNHFNVFINKGADRFLLTSYERDVIRPHVLGKFEDLLVATAQSPAMLFYLDNWLSAGPNSDVALGIKTPPRGGRRFGPGPQNRPVGKRKQASGLNENYGRELMELHTLSVNGGYSQKDVTEVAKAFTGWTIEQPNKGGGFHFEPRMHEPGDKIVLGHRIKENGEKEGLEVLHLLARNPKTAHFISQKLAMRFVSDDPSPALVDRMTETFLKKDGDIREVLRTMFRSPEFWSPQTYRAKVKTPFEFVASAVRASGAQVDDARQLVGTLNNMGMMLYGMMPPTGYSMKAETWVNSSALLARMNFALGLASGKIRGVSVDPAQLVQGATDAPQALARLEDSLLGGDVSRQTHETITRQLEDPKITERRLDDPARPPNVGAIEGLILGSPEFQRR